MCGIAGALLHGGHDPVAPVQAMTERMRRRGPDAEGLWQDPDAGLCLGHRRLAIIDLDARANQPFSSADGNHVLVFNGEIYNYAELRRQLIADGAVLRTTSDTEVVVELYARKGPDALKLLRGMFALAIWDRRARRLFLARDPYGIKPLYVARTAKGILFASQVKGLLASGLVNPVHDPAGVVGFYMWGSVPEPFTLYREIAPVPAGSYVFASVDGVSAPQLYAEVGASWEAARDDSQLEALVREALDDSVRAHLVADVPVAVLLSGGVDSSVLAGLMAQHGQDIEGITVAFREFAGLHEDEAPRARKTAQYYGIRDTVRTVDRKEFLGDLPAILDAMDQPSIDGINTWFASKAVAERGYKVVLSGVGGDELFCGYSSFRTVPQTHRWGRMLERAKPLQPLSQMLFNIGAGLRGQPKIAQIPRLAGSFSGAYLLRRGLMMPDELSRILPRALVEEGLRSIRDAQGKEHNAGGVSGVAAVAAYESTHYLRNQLLRDSDWASMAHSLELRTPLVDWKLLSRLGPHVAAFADGGGKRLLARAPAKALPDFVVAERKTGFSLPITEWLDGVDRYHASPDTSAHWSRRWMHVVAEEFGVEPARAAA